MLKIYLVRHGQASFDKDDYDALSGIGQTQARRLGAFLAAQGIHFDGVICGAMLRHRQTLDNIQQGMGAPLPEVQEDARWNEYDHHNILAALDPDFANAQTMRRKLKGLENPQQAFKETFVQAVNRWVEGHDDDNYLESWPQFQTRVANALERACEHAGKRLLVVTSGGPISVLAQSLLGMQPKGFLQLNWILANAGVSRLLKGRNGLRLSTLNDYSAFDGEENLITYK
ncbi:hypothetical protein HMF8227_01910 [Saliniradius amylolyticus]|uniref:Phosphoglycerate mutase (2,3-diphosphoglycerate-independent) n=1 Tax=Saliniradius amylolyticus TaxID=2183582 RepID=A0A2S2E573_9ALTE|nr:histidine phosphatase family protein [Saliniradius amylolyticus]AWL12380.1 hypothetical protein HMF8227_01910 [Saliniradius amylolyticus]